MNVDLLAAFRKETPSGDDLEDLKHSVRHNIRYLLETRQSREAGNSEILSFNSLYCYGLSTRNLGHGDFQSNRLCREIEKMLSYYEPRLQDVLVEVDKVRERGNRLSIRIEGVLQDEKQQMVPVVFNSVLNLTSSHLSIEESRFA
ncbi:type VI secretion system baseplate subunit TssE [Endozoicomonas gorgoniicola]|uniref:Type VI secretion system baseplate subunit TssE n=1 Tax=Endozoicomonas gorgoniicola TaxID=1234144 RepID=A0ABT3MP30_9GAMM|nr:type VI secretion system baseplate subunit TssE [Endozoicomonas gorgoniicola]MCW7551133.1 type VI secretion system baseplate subunit TssE [Endozoicomonas gorgoniicola]